MYVLRFHEFTLQAAFDDLDSEQEKLDFIMSRWKENGDATWTLFDPVTNERLMWRPPWNSRKNPAQKKKYANQFLLQGLKTIFRGKFIGQAPVDALGDSKHRLVSAGGTLTDAIYDAIETDPENKHCKLVIENGITNCVDLKRSVPTWASAWLKHEANQHHDGIGQTWQ